MKKSTTLIIVILTAAAVIAGALALLLRPQSPAEPSRPTTTAPTDGMQPTQPPTEPTEPPTEPTEPPTEPTEPPTEPTQPPTEPTQPPTEPTQPPTEPIQPPTDPTQPPRTEPPAYNFTVYDADGKPVSLSAFIGKPIVLNFWASWCGPCRMEMPEFQKMYEQFGDEVHFLMVNLTGYDHMASAKAFVQSGGYSFPVYFDLTLSAGNAYGVHSFPTSVFIDAEGYLMATYVGAMSGATLQYYIDLIR